MQFVLSFLQEVIFIIVCSRSSLEIKYKVQFTKLSSTVCTTVRKFCLLLVVSIIFVRDIKIISIFLVDSRREAYAKGDGDVTQMFRIPKNETSKNKPNF